MKGSGLAAKVVFGFTQSVMVLLPVFTKGVIGAGGAFAVLGKLFAGLLFAFWKPVASMLSVSGFYTKARN